MTEPTVTYHDECSFLMLTGEGDGIVCPPGWEEIPFPWWRRVLARIFGLPVVRVFVKDLARAKVPCTVCASDDAAWCQEAGHYRA